MWKWENKETFGFGRRKRPKLLNNSDQVRVWSVAEFIVVQTVMNAEGGKKMTEGEKKGLVCPQSFEP